MEFERTYRGAVISLRQISCTAFGMRGYEVWFRNGKKALYECHQKRTLPISVGDVIRFTGHFISIDDKKFFYIGEVLDSYDLSSGRRRQLEDEVTR